MKKLAERSVVIVPIVGINCIVVALIIVILNFPLLPEIVVRI